MKGKSEYDIQAEEFLNKTGAEIKIEFKEHGKHFLDDKETRDIYNVTLKRGNRTMTIVFGNSTNDSGFKIVNVNNGKIMKIIDVPNEKRALLMNPVHNKSLRTLANWQFALCDKLKYPVPPSIYSILCCLTKYDPGTFPQFCDEFGYDTDSKKAEKTYNAVVDEWKGVCSLFTDEEIELLAEIQ